MKRIFNTEQYQWDATDLAIFALFGWKSDLILVITYRNKQFSITFVVVRNLMPDALQLWRSAPHKIIYDLLLFYAISIFCATYGTHPGPIYEFTISHHGDLPIDSEVATRIWERFPERAKNIYYIHTNLVWNISVFPMSFAFRFETPLRSSLAHQGINAVLSCGAQVMNTSGL